MKRRTLDFRSADEVIEEIQRIRAVRYQRAGNWSLTQICQHLTATMNGGMDGFGFRLPWILRATLCKWAFGYSLKKRKLGSGYPTFKMLKPDAVESADDDALIDECIRSIRRAAEFEGPIRDYPLLDNISVDDWRDFMWIHASHHLGFLIPKSD